MKKFFNKSLLMRRDDKRNFANTSKCHICGKWYKEKDIRVRDHDHIMEKFRGSTHIVCNVNFKLTKRFL